MKALGSLVALLFCLQMPAYAGGLNTPAPRVTHLDLRQAGVVMQTDWTTCGPAAAATLLTRFFGMPAAEDEMAGLARPHMPEGRDPAVTGYTLGSLQAAFASLGLTSQGYQMELEALVAYQERVGLPVLVHLDSPQPHFAVLVGRRAGRFLLADPSWGLSVESEDAFTASWSGFVLVTLPPAERVAATLQTTEGLMQEYLSGRARRLLATAALGR